MIWIQLNACGRQESQALNSLRTSGEFGFKNKKINNFKGGGVDRTLLKQLSGTG